MGSMGGSLAGVAHDSGGTIWGGSGAALKRHGGRGGRALRLMEDLKGISMVWAAQEALGTAGRGWVQEWLGGRKGTGKEGGGRRWD